MSQEPKPARTHRPKSLVTLEDLSGFNAIIDVRSPAEFADDHIPGALSCPVLDDQQRIEIGTLYKQVSPFAAKKLGAAYVSENIAQHLKTRFQDHDKNWRPLIVCWRGGQRSGAMTTVLRSIGWDACQLEGGYKAFRNQVLRDLETLPGQFQFHCLSGPTGSAKTAILRAMNDLGAQVLDLEALAGHKGSVLGQLPGQIQPSQKSFETTLWHALRQFDPARPVFIEAESRKIGTLRLPESLYSAMYAGKCTDITVDRGERVKYLLADYAYLTEQTETLKRQLNALRPILGHEQVKQWLAAIADGNFPALTESLLMLHYDPLYARARSRTAQRGKHREIQVADLSSEAIQALAKQIIQDEKYPENGCDTLRRNSMPGVPYSPFQQ